GDITTESCVPETTYIHGYFLAKEDFVVCGLPVLQRVFELVGKAVKVTLRVHDGQRVLKGDILADIEGPARAVLTGERTALNFLQHLSGIATYTAQVVNAVSGTKARITDTRKTTPGLRILEKYAVQVGGGSNHRMGLSDGVLIKDNHIVAAGGIAAAVAAARSSISHMLKIEVETTNLAEIDEALKAHADIIMLDNMTNEQMKQAVLHIGGRALVEASGNMGDRDLRAVAETGVDLISIGALTHTVRTADISLKFI
ncbi:MAG: carboxylating nicotinate-nucleotide diphosphorylase, partial [Oscillospiraceae bacterium]|nr:carboxylating nicotinate-nucleotide diphosphorylase [Oscillospiraceae bacterium]